MARALFRQEQENASDDTYVVQRGDTLAGVALRLGVKQSELKRANHMYGSRTLVAGQVKNCWKKWEREMDILHIVTAVLFC